MKDSSLRARRPRALAITALAATALLAAALPAQAKVSLKGSGGGYTLVVPGNDVVSGTVSLTLPAKAARHAKLVPYSIDCKPSPKRTYPLITLSALRNGQRTLSGPAQSIGLSRGDLCIVRRKAKVVRRITVR